MKKMIFYPAILAVFSVFLFFACQKEQEATPQTTPSETEQVTSREEGVNPERGDCGCEVRFNSVEDDSGLNKKVFWWVFYFTDVIDIPYYFNFYNKQYPECYPYDPVFTAKLGVWYPLPSRYCQKFTCNDIWLETWSGDECNDPNQKWRTIGKLTMRTNGNTKDFTLIANPQNKWLPAKTSYSVEYNPVPSKENFGCFIGGECF